jgi:hypothetical protein
VLVWKLWEGQWARKRLVIRVPQPLQTLFQLRHSAQGAAYKSRFNQNPGGISITPDPSPSSRLPSTSSYTGPNQDNQAYKKLELGLSKLRTEMNTCFDDIDKGLDSDFTRMRRCFDEVEEVAKKALSEAPEAKERIDQLILGSSGGEGSVPLRFSYQSGAPREFNFDWDAVSEDAKVSLVSNVMSQLNLAMVTDHVAQAWHLKSTQGTVENHTDRISDLEREMHHDQGVVPRLQGKRGALLSTAVMSSSAQRRLTVSLSALVEEERSIQTAWTCMACSLSRQKLILPKSRASRSMRMPSKPTLKEYRRVKSNCHLRCLFRRLLSSLLRAGIIWGCFKATDFAEDFRKQKFVEHPKALAILALTSIECEGKNLAAMEERVRKVIDTATKDKLTKIETRVQAVENKVMNFSLRTLT